MRSSARGAASVSPTSTGCRCSRSSRSTRRRASEATRGRRSPFAAPTRRRRRRSARSREPCRRASTSSGRSSPCPPSADVVGGPRAPLVLPIFPLPDVTFFPHTLLPLHVFEARYRAMIMDVLARDRRLAVVKLRPGYEATYAGKPPVHEVAGAGADRIAAAVLPDAALRQELLETLDVTPRLDRLASALDGLVRELLGGRG